MSSVWIFFLGYFLGGVTGIAIMAAFILSERTWEDEG